MVRAACPRHAARKAGSVVALSSIMGIAMAGMSMCIIPPPRPWVIGLVRGAGGGDGARWRARHRLAPRLYPHRPASLRGKFAGSGGAEKAAAFIPMGRLGDPSDIADVITFLASQAARYMTGQVVVVDGAYWWGGTEPCRHRTGKTRGRSPEAFWSSKRQLMGGRGFREQELEKDHVENGNQSPRSVLKHRQGPWRWQWGALRPSSARKRPMPASLASQQLRTIGLSVTVQERIPMTSRRLPASDRPPARRQLSRMPSPRFFGSKDYDCWEIIAERLPSIVMTTMSIPFGVA